MTPPTWHDLGHEADWVELRYRDRVCVARAAADLRRPEDCCASVQDGYGHHAGCQNAPQPGDLAILVANGKARTWEVPLHLAEARERAAQNRRDLEEWEGELTSAYTVGPTVHYMCPWCGSLGPYWFETRYEKGDPVTKVTYQVCGHVTDGSELRDVELY